jgi:tetratricopeptide (TPR) repeat protein
VICVFSFFARNVSLFSRIPFSNDSIGGVTMPQMSPCPEPGELERIIHGQVGAWDVERLAHHLETCSACADAVDSLLEGESVLAALRVGAANLCKGDEPVVQELIEYLRRWKQNGPTSTKARQQPQETVDTAPNLSGPAPDPQATTASSGHAESTDDVLRMLAPPEEKDELGRLGPYGILRVLGSGGMGVVFAARQVHPRRIVALKLILAGRDATRQRLTRFHSETELIARLPHANIVQVFETGEHAGGAYFTMEYVEGGNLAQRLAVAPLAARTAAELVEDLARAVKFAHEHGIVHRDLKPANILLASDGVGSEQANRTEAHLTPKITDFGLAKQMEDATATPAGAYRTESGAILGTPAYMAPEQALGQAVGPQADIYALGAILYECVTARPPFKAATLLETLEQVRTQEPVPPIRLQPKLPRDLQTICLKCLHKDPQRRYASAAALADDLRRFLDGRPITARPVRLWETAWKWARRRPAAAALCIVSMLAAVTLIAGSIVYERQLQDALSQAEVNAVQAQHAKIVADTNAEQVRKQRERADASFRAAREALDKCVKTIVDDPRMQRGALDDLRRAVYDAEKAFFEKFLDIQGSDPAFQLERAAAYKRLAYVSQALGAKEEGLGHFRKAVAIVSQLAAEHPQDSAHSVELWVCHNNLGEMCRQVGRAEEAEPVLRKAVDIAQEQLREHPGVAIYQYRVGRSLNNLGLLYCETRRLDEAWRKFDAALKLLRDAYSSHPDDTDCLAELARTQENHGVLFGEYHRRPTAARSPLEHGVANYRLLYSKDPTNPDRRFGLAHGLNSLGACYWGMNELQKAEETLSESRTLLFALTQERPLMAEYRRVLGIVESNLAGVYMQLGRAQAVEEMYRNTIELRQKLADDSPTVADYQHELGIALYRRATLLIERDPAAARDQLENAIKHGKKAVAANSKNALYREQLRFDHWQLAEACLRLEDHEAASKAALSEAVFGTDGWQAHTMAATVLARCVPLCRKDNRLREPQRQERSEAYARQAVELLNQAVLQGLRDPAALKQDSSFEPLRDRTDYQDLLRRLENKPM